MRHFAAHRPASRRQVADGGDRAEREESSVFLRRAGRTATLSGGSSPGRRIFPGIPAIFRNKGANSWADCDQGVSSNGDCLGQ